MSPIAAETDGVSRVSATANTPSAIRVLTGSSPSAHELGVDGAHIDATIALEIALARSVGRPLPINIDAVYTAILAEIGFPAELANAVFIASRMTGVMAHVAEELGTMPPMRRIDPVAHRYGGPPARNLPVGGSE